VYVSSVEAAFAEDVTAELIRGLEISGVALAVSATASNCQTLEMSDDDIEYTCGLRWTWSGVAYEQNRETGEIYRTGTRILIYIDPRTGDVDDHDVGKIVSMVVFAIIFLLVSAWLWLTTIVHFRGTRPHSPRHRLRRLDVPA
jgi:hypothetical protein